MPRATKGADPGTVPSDTRSIVPRGTQWQMCGRIWDSPQEGQPAYACNARVRPEKLAQHCQEYHGWPKVCGTPMADRPIAGQDYTGDVLWLSPYSWRNLCEKRGRDPNIAPRRPYTRVNRQRDETPPPLAPPEPTYSNFQLGNPGPSAQRQSSLRRPAVPSFVPSIMATFHPDYAPASHFGPSKLPLPSTDGRKFTPMQINPEPTPLPPPPPPLVAPPRPFPRPFRHTATLPSFRELLNTLPEEIHHPPSRPHQPHYAPGPGPVYERFFMRTGDDAPDLQVCGRFPLGYCLLPQCPHERR